MHTRSPSAFGKAEGRRGGLTKHHGTHQEGGERCIPGLPRLPEQSGPDYGLDFDMKTNKVAPLHSVGGGRDQIARSFWKCSRKEKGVDKTDLIN